MAAAPASPRFATPEAYTPKYLAEKILTSRSTLEGERKQVTVLFADVRGSMELLAGRDAEEARRLLDPVLERMMEAVHRYEGTVNQVMGDGIMALFGAPLAHEDHAVRACYAALRMQESLKQYAEEARRTQGVPIHIRVGLNSGEVVVRSISSDLHMEYTAVGQTTHLAARMEQLAMPGSILITPETLRLVEGYVEVTALGPMRVKGLSVPLEVYEIIGSGPVRSRLQAAAARGLTNFVGRQEELEALRQTLERARNGQGQVVALVGEPGVGKSRLVWQFTRSHRTVGWLILEAASASYGKATAYFPVIELLKGFFQIEPRDDPRKIREKLTGKILTLDETLKPALPAFLELFSVTVDDIQWKAFDPAQRRQRTLEALKHLLLRESQVRPVLLIFEDLHWIDPETQALLDTLVESLPTARVLLLTNYRPEYQHTWGNKTYYTQLRIDPLPPETAEGLLGALLGPDPALAPLKRLLIARTEGNPFFLEESVHTLVETKVIAGERGAYRQVRPVESTQVPATVQALLAARIDRLAPEHKRLLQSASVTGRDIPFPLLQAVSEQGEEELASGLAQLRAAEFLYEASLFPDLEYTFKHALTHEVAYGSLLQERRRELHARILRAIETLYPDRLGEQAERLAHHALRGEVWDKAITYLRQAANRAAARAAYRDAVAKFEQALDVLAHLPQSRDTDEQAVDLRLDLRHVLFPLGEFGLMGERLREAEKVAAALNDQERLRRISSYLAQEFRAWGIATLQVLIGEHRRAVDSAHRALDLATAGGDYAREIMAAYALGEAYHALGDYRRALEFLKRNLELLQADREQERFSRLGFAGLPSAFSHGWAVRCLAELGEFSPAVLHAEDALRIAGVSGESVDLLEAQTAAGELHLRQGNLKKAVAFFERCLELIPAPKHPYWFPVIASSLGSAYAHLGRPGEAIPLLEEAVEQAASMRLMGRQALRLAHLAEGYLLAGRLEDAKETAVRALSLASSYQEEGHQAWILWVLGEAAAHHEPRDRGEAADFYRQATALASARGMRPLIARCHLGLGKLHRRAGSAAQARAELSPAADLFRSMEMALWAARADDELTKVPAR